MKVDFWRAFTAILFLMGCASHPDPTRVELNAAGKLASEQDSPELLRPFYQRIYWEGESQATLNRMRLASAAIEQEAWNNAERALDEILVDIEALGPADERSRKALSKFEAEDIKRFKGEAYERSMACFLRGILYCRAGEWDNARACFKSVQIQDAAKQDPALKANWASAYWMEGWCNRKLGEIAAARECWKQCADLKGPPPPSEQDNTVAVALLGFGPVKIPQGDYGEQLAYREGSSRCTEARLTIKNASYRLTPAEDLLSQARSRGMRHMDRVNQDKADTRSATETAGDVLIYGGMGATVGGAATENTTVAASGLGAVALGMATKGVASSMKPKADTRTWDLLPASIHLLPLHLSAGSHNLEFQFLDSGKKVIAERKLTVQTNPLSSLILLTQR